MMINALDGLDLANAFETAVAADLKLSRFRALGQRDPGPLPLGGSGGPCEEFAIFIGMCCSRDSLKCSAHRMGRVTALPAIDECAGQLSSFTGLVGRKAVEKGRILRGAGRDFPPEDNAGYWDGTSEREIVAQAEALKAALPPETARENEAAPPPPAALPGRALAYWNRSQWWLGPIGLTGGIAGLFLTLVG